MSRLASVAGVIVVLTGLIAACSGGSSTTAPASDADAPPPSGDVVVARYADTTITVDAFEARYVRSTADSIEATTDSLGAYEDFLDRYLNFRLKVRAARDAGMDTLASLQREVSSYRQQMAQPRLIESEVVEPVVRTLYERRKDEVQVRHLLIRVEPNASPSDTLQAYRTAQSMLDSLEHGVDFGGLARRQSEDPSAQREGQRGYEGNLGYLTAGQVVKPFEDEMYTTPVGETSGVFRTQFGYHILKVTDRRPRPQPRRIAHILIRPDSASAEDSLEARRLADSLRTALDDGASFDALAREHSDDRRSAARGGDLGFIQSGQRLPERFRDAVAAFDSVGAVSDVVETRFGYHILRFTDQQTRPTFDEAFDDLKQQASRLPRMERQREAFARSVRARHDATVDTALVLRAAQVASTDSLGRTLLADGDDASASSPETFATLGDSTYTLAQLRRYVTTHEDAPTSSIGDVIDDFLNDRATTYAAAALESRDATFAAMMEEYREGLLLFQYMQDSVWTVAAQDTAGLRATYRNHPDRYRFSSRVRTVVFRSAADSLLMPYDDAHAEGVPLDSLVRRAVVDSLAQVDTAFVTDASNNVFRPVLDVDDGARIGPVASDGEALLLIRDTQLPARRKTFDEARSAVVRDYQDAYEAEVVERLRRRYDAKAYPDRLKYAFHDEETSATSNTSP